LFDPKISNTNIDWQIDETADRLINTGEIEPMIVVGIYNTENRSAEYTPGETCNLYMKFIVEKLKPFIDKNYRTLTDRENTFVGGSSSGGTISFMLLWEYPHIFSKAACFSPAFVTRNFNYVNNVDDTEIAQNIELYIYNGGIGLEKQLQPGIDLMIKTLDDKGYREGQDYLLLIDERAEHNEAAWAKRVPQMLKILFGD